ncbi:MAG TPA: 23S rRNA (guanosine(2251)-2'-O)-methyltransferase RlmB [Firmicutes bacterium]|nr:23S rRNA (guanosine(2251)-2'-O)-methyltransferase RlmB [Bacillota bacterium]
MNDVGGRRPVLELLRSGREVNKLLVARGQKRGSIRRILALAKDQGIVVQEVDRHVLDSMSKIENHQGVIAQVAPISYWDLEEILAQKKDSKSAPLFLLLDGIQDPYNLGSLLRTGEALGVDAAVIPRRRAVGVTAAVMSASAGAASHIPISRVNSIAATIDILKAAGLWIVGADMAGETVYKQDLPGPLALAIGSEGDGLSRLVKEKCDFLVSIPMLGKTGSLNASVAGAIVLYEIMRQRGL